MKTHRVFGFLLCIAIALALAVYLHRNRPNPDFAAETVQRSMRIGYSVGSELEAFLRESADSFAVVHPGVQFEFVPLGERSQSQPEKERETEFETQEWDVALVPDRIVYESRVATADLTDWTAPIANTIEPLALSAFRHQGRQTALPFAGQALLLFVNTSSLEKASAFHGTPVPPPGDQWTLAEFLRTAEQLTCDFDRDGVTDQYGILLPDWFEFQPFLWSMGGTMTDENHSRWTFSGPRAESAMNIYRGLATGDRVAIALMELSNSSDVEGFASGKFAMRVAGPEFMGRLRDGGEFSSYRVAHIPRGFGGRETVASWDVLVMSAGISDERATAAAKFLRYLVSQDVQTKLARLGRALPCQLSALQAAGKDDSARLGPFVEALSYARTWNGTPFQEPVRSTISRYFEEAADSASAFRSQEFLKRLGEEPVVLQAFSPH